MSVIALLPAIGGLFDSSGPDATKWKERSQGVALATAAAETGSRDAWLTLGALSGTYPAPTALTWGDGHTSRYMSIAAGWASTDWGQAYKPIQSAALSQYQRLAPRFNATPGNPSQVSVYPIPTLPVTGGPAPVAAPAESFVRQYWWALLAAAVALLFYFRRK